MGKLTVNLGYGHTGTAETSTFARLLRGEVEDDEVLQFDRTSYLPTGFEYVAVAPTGSQDTDYVWNCVRCTWINNRKIKMQYRANIAWTERFNGWL